jgi:hypothetical protein
VGGVLVVDVVGVVVVVVVLGVVVVGAAVVDVVAVVEVEDVVAVDDVDDAVESHTGSVAAVVDAVLAGEVAAGTTTPTAPASLRIRSTRAASIGSAAGRPAAIGSNTAAGS